MTLPGLGLLLGAEPPAAVHRLLLTIADRVRPVDGALSPDGGVPPTAYLWRADSVRPPADARYAVWLRPEDTELIDGAAALVTDDLALADEYGAIFVPERTLVHRVRPILPFVRRRLRAGRGLPSVVVACGEHTTWLWLAVDQGVMEAQRLTRSQADTAAGVANAVAAVGRALPTALAWGAPTVTDAASAATLGAVEGVHVLVAESYNERIDLARELAEDEARATPLAWQGRRLMETRHDLQRSSRDFLAALRLPTHRAGGAGAPWRDALAGLSTPETSPVRARIGSLVAPLPAHIGGE